MGAVKIADRIAEEEKEDSGDVPEVEIILPHEENKEEDNDKEHSFELESRPSLVGKSKWFIFKKKAQRYLSDCSMGQHYHVFFHKRRYSYGSPVCGFLSLIVYAALLFYMGQKFLGLILKKDYVNVETFKPIDFTSYNLDIGSFFQKVNMQIKFDTYFNTTWDC